MTDEANRKPPFNARGLVLWAMYKAGVLNDESMPVEKMRVFKYKAFSDWPEDMQDQLRPFGAEMIGPGEKEPEEPLGGLFAMPTTKPPPATP